MVTNTDFNVDQKNTKKWGYKLQNEDYEYYWEINISKTGMAGKKYFKKTKVKYKIFIQKNLTISKHRIKSHLFLIVVSWMVLCLGQPLWLWNPKPEKATCNEGFIKWNNETVFCSFFARETENQLFKSSQSEASNIFFWLTEARPHAPPPQLPGRSLRKTLRTDPVWFRMEGSGVGEGGGVATMSSRENEGREGGKEGGGPRGVGPKKTRRGWTRL